MRASDVKVGAVLRMRQDGRFKVGRPSWDRAFRDVVVEVTKLRGELAEYRVLRVLMTTSDAAPGEFDNMGVGGFSTAMLHQLSCSVYENGV